MHRIHPSSIASLGFVVTVLAQHIEAQEVWSAPELLTEIASLSAAGDVQLEHPIGATRLSDGTVVVGDAGLSAVGFFDRTGKRVAVVGRQGAGPGEFNGLWWIGQCARDTVFAWDLANARISLVAANGRHVRDTTPPLSGAEAGRTAFATCSRDGRFGFISLPSRLDPQKPIQRAPATITMVMRNGATREIGRDIASSEFVMRGGGGAPRPLGLSTTLALSDDRIYVGTGDSASVLAFAVSGQFLRSIQIPLATGRPVTENQYNLAVEELLLRAPPNATAAIRSMMHSLPRPERLPHYNTVHTDPSGNLWLVQSVVGEVTRLIGVDRSGRTIGSVQLAEHVQVWEVGDDYVLGQRHNADGEPFVVVYRLERRRP